MVALSQIQRITEHPGFIKYFKNTSWMLAGKIFSLIVNFFVSAYIARYLGPSDFGTLNYVISFASLFAFASLGTDQLIVKGLNENKNDHYKWLGTGFSIKIIGSILVIAISTISSAFFNSSYITFLVFIFSSFTLFQTFSIIDFYFQSKVIAKYSTISFIGTTFFVSAIKLLFIHLSYGVAAFLAIFSIESFFLGACYLYFYKKRGGNFFSWRFDKEIFRFLIVHSPPFIISSIATAIYYRIDQILLKFILDTQTVGLYSVAARLSEVWMFIPSIICASLFPAIINAKKHSEELFNKRISKLYSLAFYLSISIAGITTFIAPFIIRLLYGPEYYASIIILQIYVWTLVGMFISIVLQQYLLIDHKLYLIVGLNILGMTINIGSNLILIPRLGAPGAAISNVISYILPLLILLSLPQLSNQRQTIIKGILLKKI